MCVLLYMLNTIPFLVLCISYPFVSMQKIVAETRIFMLTRRILAEVTAAMYIRITPKFSCRTIIFLKSLFVVMADISMHATGNENTRRNSKMLMFWRFLKLLILVIIG